jgi:hypothetical protein
VTIGKSHASPGPIGSDVNVHSWGSGRCIGQLLMEERIGLVQLRLT